MWHGGQSAAMTRERNLALKPGRENAPPRSDKAFGLPFQSSQRLATFHSATPAHGVAIFLSAPHQTRHSPAAKGDQGPSITRPAKEP